MFTQSHLVSRTLQQVLLAVLVVVAVVMLLPDRSEASIGSRSGRRPAALQAHRCCLPPQVPTRQVVVRSVGRQRIVVRNDLTGLRPGLAANRCSSAGCDRVWVPGHYKVRVKHHGPLRKVWIPGHWA